MFKTKRCIRFLQSANDDCTSRDDEEDMTVNDEDDGAAAVKDDDEGETVIKDCDKGKDCAFAV